MKKRALGWKRWIPPILFFLFFLFVSYISYQQLFFHGYTFEEWQKHGETRGLESIITSEFFLTSPLSLLVGKGRVLGSLFYNCLIYYFGNTPAPYAIAGIMGHTINAFLLFLIAEKLFRKKTIAFYSSLFFLTIPISSEALSYFAAPVQTMYSLSFYLLSLYWTLVFLERKKYIYLLVAGICIYLSLLFKESSIFFIPVIMFLLIHQKFAKKNHAAFYGTIAILLFIGGIVGFIAFTNYSAMYRSLYGFGGFSLTNTLINSFLYPVITISHFILPERFFVRLGTQYIQSVYPSLGWIPSYVYTFIYTSFAVDIVSLLFTIPIGLFLFYGYLRTKQKLQYTLLCVLYWISFLPISIVQQQRSTGFLERRYYYGVNPAFVLLMAAGITNWVQQLPRLSPRKRVQYPIYILLALGFVFLLVKNVTIIHQQLADQLVTSSNMRMTTDSIRAAHPNIPDKPVFFIENGQDLFSHYGTGYMLALLYADTHKIPLSLLEYTNVNSPLFYAKHIWKKEYEGYVSEEDRAIGFFYKLSSLISFLNENPGISNKQLVGFAINGSQIEPLSEHQMSDMIQQ